MRKTTENTHTYIHEYIIVNEKIYTTTHPSNNK